MDYRVKETAKQIGADLDQIQALFKPGSKVALAVWCPGDPDRDFVMMSPDATNDEAAGVFLRRRDDPETITGKIE